MLEPEWPGGSVPPNSLVDLLDTGDREEEEEVEDYDEDIIIIFYFM